MERAAGSAAAPWPARAAAPGQVAENRPDRSAAAAAPRDRPACERLRRPGQTARGAQRRPAPLPPRTPEGPPPAAGRSAAGGGRDGEGRARPRSAGRRASCQTPLSPLPPRPCARGHGAGSPRARPGPALRPAGPPLCRAGARSPGPRPGGRAQRRRRSPGREPPRPCGPPGCLFPAVSSGATLSWLRCRSRE